MSRINGDEDEPIAPHPTLPPEVKSALQILTNEVHANTVAVGRLTAEQAGLRSEFRDLQNKVGRMRGRLESVPDAARASAEDTARHEVEKLRREIDRLALEEAEKGKAALEKQIEDERKAKASAEVAAEAKRKETRERRLLIALAVFGPPAAALVTHIVHLLTAH